MDKKEMIKLAINMLESVDPESIEIVNFDRTEYDDGSTMFSVNLTTPATGKEDRVGTPPEQGVVCLDGEGISSNFFKVVRAGDFIDAVDSSSPLYIRPKSGGEIRVTKKESDGSDSEIEVGTLIDEIINTVAEHQKRKSDDLLEGIKDIRKSIKNLYSVK